MTVEVGVDSVSPRTTEKALEKYFSICGKVEAIKKRRNGAFIVFAKNAAAQTALLLNGAYFEGRKIATSIEDGEAPLTANASETLPQQTQPEVQMEQEDKPHAAKFAEYLAHGYTFPDELVEKAITTDKNTGISDRFLAFFKGVELHGSHRSTELTLDSEYYLKALASSDGPKIKEFYTSTNKLVHDVREEGLRIQTTLNIVPEEPSVDSQEDVKEASHDVVDDTPVYHVDFGWFKPTATQENQDLVINMIRNLSNTCGKYPPGSDKAGETCLEAIELTGRNISPHGAAQGFVDTFVMRFPNRAARDFYMEQHPGHGDIRFVLNPYIAKIMILDFEDGNFAPHDAIYKSMPSSTVVPGSASQASAKSKITKSTLSGDGSKEIYQIMNVMYSPEATSEQQSLVQKSLQGVTSACSNYLKGTKMAGATCVDNFMLCGRNISPHGKDQGYHDMFIIRFPNREARDYYMDEHPARREIVKVINPYVAKLMVFDFEDGNFYPSDAFWKYTPAAST